MSTEHPGEHGPPDCYRCAEAIGGEWPWSRMYLCPTCGNKRCPKATDHRLDCSGSNEPGQPGSRYQYGPVGILQAAEPAGASDD